MSQDIGELPATFRPGGTADLVESASSEEDSIDNLLRKCAKMGIPKPQKADCTDEDQVDQLLRKCAKMGVPKSQKADCANEDQVDQLLRKCAKMGRKSKNRTAKHNLVASTKTSKNLSKNSLEGKQLDRYQILTLVGEGGMGKVYKAYDTKLARVVALKIIHPEVAQNEIALKRFIREAKSTAQFHHSQIVSVLDLQEIAGHYCIIMNFINGFPLDYLISKRNFDHQRTCKIIIGVLQAMQYAHNKRIIHRDLKPSNILIDRDENVFITDFGIAKMLDSKESNLTEAGKIIGTIAYMSLEQARGKQDLDHRSDIYSIGAIFYEMLTHKTPFRAKTPWKLLEKIATAEITLPQKIDPQIPKYLEKICMKALARNPEKRYPNCDEMAADIEKYLHTSQNQRSYKHLGVLVAASFVGILALFLLFKGPDHNSENIAEVQTTSKIETKHDDSENIELVNNIKHPGTDNSQIKGDHKHKEVRNPHHKRNFQERSKPKNPKSKTTKNFRGLPREQIAEEFQKTRMKLSRHFRRIDRNKDEQISISELRSFLEFSNMRIVRFIMKFCDHNNDQLLTKWEIENPKQLWRKK